MEALWGSPWYINTVQIWDQWIIGVMMANSNEKRKFINRPAVVIQRGIRIKCIRLSQRLARPLSRIWLTLNARKVNRARNAAFDEIVKQATKSENSQFESNKVFFNLALYFLIAEKDIQAVKIDALTHHDFWKRQLSLRIILLTIHEWDMDKVAGRKLKNAMQMSGVHKEIQLEMENALRDVRKAQRRAQDILSNARNATIAHRDPDALKQYRMIRDLDSKLVFQVSGEFYDASRKFITAMPKVILAGGSMQGLLKQMLNNPNK